jgi:malonyl-CoA decarboxylase
MSDRTSFLDGVFDRTISNLRGVWRDIAAQARGALSAAPRPDLPSDDADRLRVQFRDCLDGKGGEVSARARAAALGRTYLALNESGHERFLRLLATEFDIDRDAVRTTWERLERGQSDEERMRTERALRRSLEAPRIKLLRQFNALPEGVKFLVDMRAQLMSLSGGDPALMGLELDLKDLLAQWFDIGFLEVKRITWDSSASLLEKLTGYEAVHAIRSWKDLKNRLEADRRCFAYFHPRMPDEPLIFVEVALTQGMADNVQLLLDEKAPVGDPADADAAIFYSISNCQRGLTGISFGDFLIKRVVDQLAAELPHVRIYATLSPMPGFRAWVDKRINAEGDSVLLPTERKALDAVPLDGNGSAEPRLRRALARPGWHKDELLAQAMKPPLMRLAARYLVTEKTPTGRALDPVAHFHLSNGARVERLNWRGDLSAKGLQQSWGLMVNYLYRLADIEENHEAYSGEGRVAASSTLQKLAKG